MKGFLEEFRNFAIKGNVVDMAIGIVVGVAFNSIVTSLVNDIIMPPIGYLLGGDEFKALKVVLREGTMSPDETQVAEVAIRYGAFVNTIIQFIIISFSAFIVVKVMNRVIREREG